MDLTRHQIMTSELKLSTHATEVTTCREIKLDHVVEMGPVLLGCGVELILFV